MNAICIKVDNLRKLGYTDLRHWMNNPNNLYTGRHGRIFITDKRTGVKDIYHYPSSKWGNPYSLKNYTLQQALQMYVLHLLKSGLIYELDELEGKTLGCFCDKQKTSDGHPLCHAQVLVDLLHKCKHLIPKR